MFATLYVLARTCMPTFTSGDGHEEDFDPSMLVQPLTKKMKSSLGQLQRSAHPAPSPSPEDEEL